jgi:hypothetical protein
VSRSGSLLGRVVAGLTIQGIAMRWEKVHCECADKECRCEATCRGLACYCWGSVDDGTWQYLCRRCAGRLVERGTAPYSQTRVEGVSP